MGFALEGGYLLFLGAVLLLGVGLGLLLRWWWTLAALCVPWFLWLLLWLPTWSEPDGDGSTGADWFFFGFLYVGLR